MGQKALTQEQAQEALDAVVTHGGQRMAARALGIPNATLQNRLAVADRMKLKPTAEAKDSPRLLKAEVSRLRTELKQLASTHDINTIITGIIGKMTRDVSQLDIPQWVVDPHKRKPESHGVPTLFLSDLHWGEVVKPSQVNGVNEFNLRIAHRRMDNLVERAIYLLRILDPHMRYPGIVIPLGGDMISGNIHEELQATNELNTMPTVLDLYGKLVQVITTMADTFGKVFLPCVTGNHGRDTRKIWMKDRTATSFDWLLYKFLAKHFDNDKRVTFYIPDGAAAYYRVYNHRYWLQHGDSFRAGESVIGPLGPIIRGDHRTRSRNSQVGMEYDCLLLGHWHFYCHLTRLIINGSSKGYDEYAFNCGFPYEVPQQALWITHPKYGITFRMPVQVEQPKIPGGSSDWVTVR